jgi:MYXO-CTERM domain-containing protein
MTMSIYFNVSQKLMTRAATCSVFALVFSVAGLASASPNYPDVVKEVAGSSCAPTCLLCHSTNPGKAGSVISPGQGTLFAKTDVNSTMLRPGIAPAQSDDAIRAAFIRMRDGDATTAPTDADGDGESDFAELAKDVNPNPGNEELCEIQYGCGARVAPTGPNRGFAIFSSVAVALGLIGLTLRARRR